MKGEMKPVRTFIAIELPGGVREELSRLQEELASPNLAAKWVSRENIHLTVKFLGSVESDRIAEIRRVLRDCLRDEEAFHFTLSGVGAFPSLSRPKVVWVGVGEGKEELRRIARKIEDALDEIGFPKESRGFSAHVTLARIKRAEKTEELKKKIEEKEYGPRQVRMSKVAIMKSDLTPQGPIYTRLDEVKLGGLLREKS